MIDLEDPNDPLARIEAQNAALRAYIDQLATRIQVAGEVTERGFERLGGEFGRLRFVDELNRDRHTTINKQLASLDADVVNLTKRMNKRFEQVDTKVADMDTKLDDMDIKLDAILVAVGGEEPGSS